MQTMKLLLFLIDGHAISWRVKLAAKALMARIILAQSPSDLSLTLIDLRDRI